MCNDISDALEDFFFLISEHEKSYSLMTMQQNWRKYNATVTHGESKTLKGDGSDVSLTVPAGQKGVYMTKVHIDHFPFKGIIPDEECFIGPLVEVKQHLFDEEENETGIHKLCIPHYFSDEKLWNEELWKFIRVRHGNRFRQQSHKEVPRGNDRQGNSTYFKVKSKLVVIYTTSFSIFTCSICKRECPASARIFLLGNLSLSQEGQKTIVKVKPYVCSSLYIIEDYRNVSTEELFVSSIANSHYKKFPSIKMVSVKGNIR